MKAHYEAAHLKIIRFHCEHEDCDFGTYWKNKYEAHAKLHDPEYIAAKVEKKEKHLAKRKREKEDMMAQNTLKKQKLSIEDEEMVKKKRLLSFFAA